MNHCKHKKILDSMLQSIEKRDGRKPQNVADEHATEVNEGMYREATLQIIASEPFKNKFRLLILYPELIIPYFFRIRKKQGKSKSG